MGKEFLTELELNKRFFLSLDALKAKSVNDILKKFLSACSSYLLKNIPLDIQVILYLARL